MRLPQTVLGIAIETALNGIILHDGNPVPIYDQFAPDSIAFPRIIITPAIGGPQIGSKVSYRIACVQTIKITMAFADDVTSNPVNDIANQITQILIPGTTGPYINIGADFKIMLVTLSGVSDQNYQDQYFKYTDKNLLLNFIIEQTNLL